MRDTEPRVWKPRVGQKVRLTEMGMRLIDGLRSWAEVEAARAMVVTRVEEAGTVPECWDIDVDGPLGMYLLTSECVEPIEET